MEYNVCQVASCGLGFPRANSFNGHMLKLRFPSAAAAALSHRQGLQMHFGETPGSICSVALRPGRVLLLLLLRLFRTSQDRRRGSISRFRYLICASTTAAPVISGAAPGGVVDSQLCTQTPSMLNTNGNLLSDGAALHPSLHFKATLVIFSSFTIHCLYGLCASL